MEKFQGIFDQGFSGIIEDNRKTMPDFMEKLADQEMNYEPPKVDVPNIPFDNNFGLARANELTSDGSREVHISNMFTNESIAAERPLEQIAAIDIETKQLSYNGLDFDSIQAKLLNKFERPLVNKYMESTIKLILNKFSNLGFENIKDKQANIREQAKTEFNIKRSTVHDILDKFSKLEFITAATTKEYRDMLGSKRPLFVASKFLFSLDKIKNDYYANKEARTAFKRDVDQKDLNLRDIDNNTKKNSNIEKQNTFASMLSDYKQGIYNKQAKSQICNRLAKVYGVEKAQVFLSAYKNDINRIEKFFDRQAFDTDFASSALQGVEIQPKAKQVAIDTKAMTCFSLDLLTNGSKLSFVNDQLKKKYGYEVAMQFLAENNDKLQKHYGQIGYLFIDSNIYSNCNEMVDSYSKIQHEGSKLIYSLKANPKCTSCSLNKEGICEKTGLMISNNPIARSPRAAKRVFERASLFAPKAYIESFKAQVKNEQGNLELISKFALGLNDAIVEDRKNIGKTACKDRVANTSFQESFVSAESYDTEIFNQDNTSKIIDEVLGL